MADPAGKEGYAFVIRPERRGIAWWRLADGVPVEQVAGGIYRPAGWNSVLDMAGELALVVLAAGVLALISWLVSVVVGRTAKTQRAQSSQTIDESHAGLLERPYVAPLLFIVGGTVLAAAACLLMLDGIPHVQDDVAYIFQGKIFALGRSWVPTPPGPEFFANGFIQMFEGRWFTKYPPGYPLLLVPALWAGMPWLVNALSAGVTLALVYMTGRRVYIRYVAVWAGLLGLLSPWIILMSGSYMSHPTTMMWVALFAYAVVRTRDEGRGTMDDGRIGAIVHRPSSLVWPLLGGFAMGMAFITREWTAIGIGAGAAIWALGDVIVAGRERWVRLGRYALMLVGFVPPLLFLLYENRQLTGDWFRLAQDLVGSYDTPGFGPGHGDAVGHTPALGVYNTLVYLRTLATMFDGWPAPLALAPVFLGLFAWVGEGSRKRLGWDLFNVMCVLGLVGAYFLWWSSTTVFGPRYWYEAMPFLLLLAGRGLDLLGRLAGIGLGGALAARLRWGAPGVLFAVLALYNVTQSIPYQVTQYRDYNGISATALRNSEDAGLKNALVFVALDPTKPNRDYGKVFFANDPLLRGDVVYARDLGPDRNRGLVALFPGRTPYWLPLDGPPQAGVGPPQSP
jgi:4-amino-4-deoxy-L-arabinose transferase-like glycosyltransferase